MATLHCAEEIAYDEIRRRILNGRLPPGTRLVHRNLAKELGFSSGPIVLALRTLERDGLITNTPGLGAHVTAWSRDEIVDLYRIRAANEGVAARLCAERASKAELDAIVATAENIKQAIDANDVAAYVDTETEFHRSVVRGAHCERLAQIIGSLATIQYSMPAFAAYLKIPRKLSTRLKDVHDSMVEAILSRDPDRSELAARTHVEDSLARNIEWIEQVNAAFAEGLTPQSSWWAKR